MRCKVAVLLIISIFFISCSDDSNKREEVSAPDSYFDIDIDAADDDNSPFDNDINLIGDEDIDSLNDEDVVVDHDHYEPIVEKGRYFKDKALEKCVYDWLIIWEIVGEYGDDIPVEGFEKFEKFVCNNIVYFDGIEKLKNVKILVSGRTGDNPPGPIYSLKPILKLPKLEGISFKNMNLKDDFFKEMILFNNIKTLWLTKVDISNPNDLNPIIDLNNLEELIIEESNITTLPNTIENMDSLKRIDITKSDLTDISNIHDMDSLETLNIMENKINKIPNTFKNLPLLKTIGIQENGLQDIASLGNIASLKLLNMGDNNIKKIPESFSNLKNLETFYCGRCGLEDISNLAGATNLKILDLSNNEIQDISVLDYLKNLEEVFLDGNNIDFLPEMEGHEKLWNLNLGGNEMESISAFANPNVFPNLEWLDIGHNYITSFEPFRKRYNLTRLQIDHNCVLDMSPIDELAENGVSIWGYDEPQDRCKEQ